VRDWTIGSTLSYASGLPILAPTSTNNLSTLLFRSTYFNRNPGVPLFLQNRNGTTTPLADLNCHCIDPTQDLVLNPAAWSNPTAGNWGTAAPYYNDYRYQRRPSESFSVGRVFAFKEQMRLTIRMNFVNIFNRLEMSNPSATAPTGATTKNATTGLLTGGYGFVNYVGGSTFVPPRQGTLEMRFSF